MKAFTLRRVFFSACACILTAVFLYSFGLFLRLGKLIRRIDHSTLATIPVDFSKPGIYTSEFRHDCDPLYGKFVLILNTDAKVQSPDDARNLVESLEGRVWIKNLDGRVVNEWPMNGDWWVAYAFDLRPRLDIYQRFPHGNYQLQIEVTNGTLALGNHRQTLVFNYGTIHERSIYPLARNVSLITLVLAAGCLFLGFRKTNGHRPPA